jgi:hypothetical protein
MLLAHVDQLMDRRAKSQVIEDRVLPLCAAERLRAEHPFHPGVLLRLLSLSEAAGLPPSTRTDAIEDEVKFLTTPAWSANAMPSAVAPIRKIELLALTFFNLLLPTHQMCADDWRTLTIQLFHGNPLQEDVAFAIRWEKRFQGPGHWHALLDHLPHMQPWRTLLFDALNRMYYTPILFCNARFTMACFLPIRITVERTTHPGNSIGLLFDGSKNIEQWSLRSFGEPLAEAAMYGYELANWAGKVDGGSFTLRLNVRYAEVVLDSVAEALGQKRYPVEVHRHLRHASCCLGRVLPLVRQAL